MSAGLSSASTAAATHTEIRDTTMRALRKPGGGWYALVGALSVIVLFGIYAWIHQLRYGMGSAGFNDHAFWAIDLANVITFIGVSYGGAVVSAVLRLTGATWRAPLTRLAEGTAVSSGYTPVAMLNTMSKCDSVRRAGSFWSALRPVTRCPPASSAAVTS